MKRIHYHQRNLILREGCAGRPVGQIASMAGVSCGTIIAILLHAGIEPVKARFDPVQAAQDALAELAAGDRRAA